jgi:acyl-CoA thioesterase
MRSMTPDQLARRCADVMWADDVASQRLGMTLDAVTSGAATVSMTVRGDMTNGHGTAHGGFIFALADSAFAFACNSYNRRTVAAGAEIRFRRPTRLGDVLTASATERSREGREGVYEITVTTSAEVVAEFVGRSREIGGTLFDQAQEKPS